MGLLMLATVPAQAQHIEYLFAKANTAFETGSYEMAERLYQHVIKQDRQYAEAYHQLTLLYLDTPLHDLKKAEKHIQRARRIEPHNVRFMETELQQLRLKTPHTMAASSTDSRRRHLAEKMLKIDANNSLALEELGLFHFEEFRWYSDYIQAHYPAGSASLARKTEKQFAQSTDAFKKAIALNPKQHSAYVYLIRAYLSTDAYEEALDVSQRMTQTFPKDDRAWLYLGVVEHNLYHPDIAKRCFERALRYMPDERRHTFENIESFLFAHQKPAYASNPDSLTQQFWANRDPRLLTNENERQLEHYARMAYATLFYGWKNTLGWETEQGQVIVRYGRPPSQQTYNTFRSRFTEWDYGDIDFVFEDYTRSGQYLFYSPPASAGSWNDYVIKSGEYFRKIPERYQFRAPNQVDFPFLVNVFKGKAGMADVYIPYGIPIEGHDPTEETIDLTLNTGVFLLSNGTVHVSHRQTVPALPTVQITQVQEDTLWVHTHHVTAKAGAYEVAVEFETPQKDAIGVARDSVYVPNFASNQLLMSDAMPAYLVEPADSDVSPSSDTILRDGLAIRPAPWGVFGTKQPIYLYFEVYNLTLQPNGRTRYSVEATLQLKDQRTRKRKLADRILGRLPTAGVSVQFEANGTTPDDAQYLVLDASEQPPGLYLLTLRIQDLMTQKTVETERVLFLE